MHISVLSYRTADSTPSAALSLSDWAVPAHLHPSPLLLHSPPTPPPPPVCSGAESPSLFRLFIHLNWQMLRIKFSQSQSPNLGVEMGRAGRPPAPLVRVSCALTVGLSQTLTLGHHLGCVSCSLHCLPPLVSGPQVSPSDPQAWPCQRLIYEMCPLRLSQTERSVCSPPPPPAPQDSAPRAVPLPSGRVILPGAPRPPRSPVPGPGR